MVTAGYVVVDLGGDPGCRPLFARRELTGEVGRGGWVGGSDRIPAGPAVADHVQGFELAGRSAGLVESGGAGGDQADPLGPARNDQWESVGLGPRG